AGLTPTLLGENVAHARNALLAHRALWASPSHRANLLEPNYDSVGIGVAEDADGSVWVSELFAKLGRTKP
ncbi:MAG TPA: CAP domain-containing protein, partial [Polyangiaceae bacterium]